MSGRVSNENLFGAYLRDRRARTDPAAFGYSQKGRRTPGLRREEVAQRANISPTWYICLEQGRGGAPSANVLDRIARALMLTEIEREHLFLLGLGRTPEIRYQRHEGVTLRLRHVLDALNPNPAFIRTATWNAVAWNHAATKIMPDYGLLPPDQRNMLRELFLSPRSRAVHYDWQSVARSVVATFRMDVARAGATAEIGALVKELCQLSPDFAAMWRENDVSTDAEAVKHIHNPIHGTIAFEYSSFAVDGRPDLTMAVYYPATPSDANKIRLLVEQ